MSGEILIPVPFPMNRDHAHMLAVQGLGRGAVVGENAQYPGAPLYVGVKEMGEWTKIGFGKTWEEAFANIREVRFQRANHTFAYVDDDKKDQGK